MSTGAECWFVERKPDEWHYEIQQYPYGDSSLKSAQRHLDRNYANPGGWSIDRHPDSTRKEEE